MTLRTSEPVGPSELLRRAAAAGPDRVALVDASESPQRRLSWAELDQRVSAAALALIDRGVADGERVVLQLPTSADFVLLFLGALRAGGVPVPLDPAYTEPEVAHVLADAGAVLRLDFDSGRSLLAEAGTGSDPRRDRAVEELAVLLYTSGTSGRVKGAMLSARALGANLEQLTAVEPPLLTESDVLFVPLPLTHVFGLNAGLGMSLRTGATLVLARRFDPAATLETMAAERVTAVLGVPGQYAAWLAQPRWRDSFAAVRFALSGSAPLPAEVAAGYEAAGITLHNGYGLTEAAPVVSLSAHGPRCVRPVRGSVGSPLPGVGVELRDADGEVVAEGDPGRVHIRGDNLFSGYWPDGADGPDPDGWFGTGDIAVLDGDGCLHLVGRSSDLVVVNGFNVYPAEVEEVLAAMPGVAEAAVIGVADAATGEAVRAFVVPEPGASLEPPRLLAMAARSLARFKLPRTLDVVTELPRTVTGKVTKWRLGTEDEDAAE